MYVCMKTQPVIVVITTLRDISRAFTTSQGKTRLGVHPSLSFRLMAAIASDTSQHLATTKRMRTHTSMVEIRLAGSAQMFQPLWISSDVQYLQHHHHHDHQEQQQQQQENN